ncbi:MAG: ParB/RepB/Spo0J family partition protein [Anaerolineales bacterium]
MSQSVELSALDLRYQGHRLQDNAREARLRASIAERGIEQPLEGVDTPDGHILLNGFKRYRCAQKLGIHWVPYVSLGNEEATAIVSLMRVSNDKALGILEQARFIVDLLTIHGLSVAEVAETLSRSKAWVSMRRTLLDEMSSEIQQILFRGAFPVYCYMYTLRQFMRMNSVKKEQIERFVQSVAGKHLSVRDIELLAHGYFRGPASLREAIQSGKLGWSLDKMKHVPDDVEGCNEFERVLLNDIEILQKYMQRVMTKCEDNRLNNRAFYAQANLLVGGVLSMLEPFRERIKEFYDRSGQA